ncbi:hypothetical protein WA026_022040 [Henosepilachna vigintioctopunctata]|uniref:Uncharacterized protein n=1 Tax=Henosepilachna vigintioctopunctata TaxID=420089 RepID=A0AAW1V1M9_9CUCU
MIESLKRAGRSNNIVAFGIKEKEKSTIELLRELKENIKQDLNIDIVNNEVNKIHRIGKKDPESNKPRPVICSFVNYWKKNEIIKSKKNLKNIHIMKDYSKETLKKRKELQTKKGKITNIANTKNPSSIIYLPLNVLILKEDENLIELTHALEHIKWDVVGLLEEDFADWQTDLQKIKKFQIVE